MPNRLEPSPSYLPLAGNLLIATTKCADNVFQRSVCLILHHGDEGSIGLLLNRPIDFDIGMLLSQLQGKKSTTPSTVVRFGGPMSGPILALHNQEELAEVSAAEGVYLAARLDKLQKLVADDAGEVRIVVGQAMWKQGQLEAEIADGFWVPIPADPRIVFAPEEEMWGHGMREAGNRFVQTITGARVPPSDVTLN